MSRTEYNKEMLIELCDKIKANPFWASLDASYITPLLDDFRKLSLNKHCMCDFKNPHFVMLNSLTHGLNQLIASVLGCQEKYTNDKQVFDNLILTLESFLHNAECMLSGNYDDVVKGYICGDKPKGLKKFKCLYDDERGEYYAVNIIYRKEQIEAVRRFLEKESKKTGYAYMPKLAKESLDDMDNGRPVIGRHWLIELEDCND